MTSGEIRKSFLDFFKKNSHAAVPSSSLIPADPSVLLTTAGVQQFKPYYTGKLDPLKDFGARRVASVQKCFRTTDIDEVGDKTHLTFFEMLGNFAFGDYFKKEALRFGYEYVVNVLGIDPARVTVSVFQGNKQIPKDEESYNIWHKEIGVPKERIKLAGIEDNFWGPTGNEGPCGPTTEIYVDNIEVWNIVFNEYFSDKSREELLASVANLKKLEAPGIDTGMGLERLLAVINGFEDIYETDLLRPILEKVNQLAPQLDDRSARVITDHLRSSIFLIADGVRPSNKEVGYILRRLLRRVLAYQVQYDVHPVRGKSPKATAAAQLRNSNGVHPDLLLEIFKMVKNHFGGFYPEVKDPRILEVMESERDKFQTAIASGLKELAGYKNVSAEEAFYIYETFGLPFELIKEMAPDKTRNLLKSDFDREFKKHQEVSRAGAEKKFGGHGLLLDTGELKAKDEEELKKVTRLHTATHLLQAALRQVLGSEIQQRGSDITVERTRFDFNFSRKLTSEEIKKVEDLVNEVIQKDLPVGFVELAKEEAEKTGALFFFKQKYPARVKVYYVGHDLKTAFSKEFCGGPHVSNTLVIGKFKIIKEEAVGSGIRRIRAGLTEI